MTQGRERTIAAWQWGAFAAATLAGAVIGWRVHSRPLDAERLHVQVSHLASLAAEGELLAQERREHRLPGNLAREHASQLAGSFAQALEKLEEADVQPSVAGTRDAASGNARTAVDGIGKIARERDPGDALPRAARALSGQSTALQDAMP